MTCRPAAIAATDKLLAHRRHAIVIAVLSLIVARSASTDTATALRDVVTLKSVRIKRRQRKLEALARERETPLNTPALEKKMVDLESVHVEVAEAVYTGCPRLENALSAAPRQGVESQARPDKPQDVCRASRSVYTAQAGRKAGSEQAVLAHALCRAEDCLPNVGVVGM